MNRSYFYSYIFLVFYLILYYTNYYFQDKKSGDKSPLAGKIQSHSEIDTQTLN